MRSYKLPASYDTLNADQKLAFAMLQYGLDSGQNYLIAGDAGTGKTYLAEAYADFCALNGISLIKAAPTGTAATNIKGSTLHKIFRLPLTVNTDGISPRQMDNIRSMISYADAIFIDEVSMVRTDVMDAIAEQVQAADRIREDRGKPKIQLILSGDFGQLQPVISPEDRQLFLDAKGYDIGSGLCFGSRYWRAMDFKPIMLQAQMRQADPAFCRALDNLRIGIGSDLDYLNNNSAPAEIPGGIWLCGLRDTAADKNALGLYRLNTPLHTSPAVISGKAKASQTNYAENLLFKQGARVMMIRNEGDLYHNGSLGTIMDIRADGTVRIELDAGRTAIVDKVKTSFYEYRLRSGRIESVEVGYILQYPFKIGYAVTIHKAQGQTYDAMNLVPEIFAKGQLYTAMSRCRTLGNIYIQPDVAGRKLTPDKLIQDPEIVRFLIAIDGEAAKYREYFVNTMGMP